MRRGSIKRSYDPELDWRTWKDCQIPIFAAKNSPQWKKELRGYNLGHSQRIQTIKNNAAAKVQTRQQAEEKVADLVRKVVGALEFAMTELQQIPAPARYQKAVSQFQLAKIIFDLKNKCGVKFEDAL